jgi:hypothetical protein
MVVPMAESKPVAGLNKRLEALALAPLLLVVTLGVGWLVWCVIEWTNGRTPSYRVLGLRVVRASDDRPTRLLRSCARSSLCLLLVIPTIVVCGVIAFSFVFGASAPDDLFRQPRQAPWDRLTATKVVDDRAPSDGGGPVVAQAANHIDLAGLPPASGAHTNGRAH